MLVESAVTSKVSSLGSEALGAAKVLYSSKQNFQHSVSDTGSVLS